jgi:hypothetical protein
MKKHILIPIIVSGILLCATGFSPVKQSYGQSSSSGTPVICYVIMIPLWILSIWYWHRHYKIRGQSAVVGVLIAIIFSGLAIAAMILDALYRALFSKQELGPCPNCGKTKIIRENATQLPHMAQPICPHCKMQVGGQPAIIVSGPSTIAQQLEELQNLVNKHLITMDEFNQKKTELLNRM